MTSCTKIMQQNNDKTLDDKDIYWCSGYDARWDGYTLGSMASTYTASQNKQFINGWIEADKEIKKLGYE